MDYHICVPLFIYSSIHINNQNIKTFNVHISAVWNKWLTQDQLSHLRAPITMNDTFYYICVVLRKLILLNASECVCNSRSDVVH